MLAHLLRASARFILPPCLPVSARRAFCKRRLATFSVTATVSAVTVIRADGWLPPADVTDLSAFTPAALLPYSLILYFTLRCAWFAACAFTLVCLLASALVCADPAAPALCSLRHTHTLRCYLPHRCYQLLQYYGMRLYLFSVAFVAVNAAAVLLRQRARTVPACSLRSSRTYLLCRTALVGCAIARADTPLPSPPALSPQRDAPPTRIPTALSTRMHVFVLGLYCAVLHSYGCSPIRLAATARLPMLCLRLFCSLTRITLSHLHSIAYITWFVERRATAPRNALTRLFATRINR